MSNTFNQNNANNSYVIVKNGKHIAGTFFEMALDNFYRTIKHALRCAAVKKANFNDDKMGEALKDLASSGLTATQLSQLSRLLFRHFPFLKPLMADAADYALYPKRKEIDDMEKQVKKLIETKKEREKNDNNADVSELNGEISDLQNQIKAANSALKKELAGVSATKQLEYLSLMAMAMTFYRNTYSHKNHYNNQDDEDTQRIRESKLAKWLEIILKGERAILLERKTHSQKDTEFLTKDGDKNYNINIDKKSKRNNDFYFGPAKTTEGLKGKETEITDFGIFFFCQLFLRRTDAEQFAKETNLYEGSPFLLLPEEKKKLQDIENKRAAEEQKLARRSGATHIVNPRTIGDNESVQNNIIREMMNMHRIRIPREKRIDADLSEGILAMDIMNELRRCPKELYDTFSPDDKASFERTGVDPDGNTVRNLLVRYADRFPELALRCIDQMELFKDIRFHLRLGRFRYRFYDKTLVDGTSATPVRTVQKEINGFGRWQDVEQKRRDKYGSYFQQREVNSDGLEQPVADSIATEPYITDWRTTYNIHANRIGMAWNLPQMADGIYLPDLKTDDGDNLHRKAPIDMPAPMCYLSIYDLPALLFYTHIYDLYHGGKYNLPTAEEIIKKKFDALQSLFEYAAQGNHTPIELRTKQQGLGLSNSEIPDTLRCFMRTKVDYDAYGVAKPFTTFGGTTTNKLKKWDSETERTNHAINVLDEVAEEAQYRLETFNKKHDRITTGGRDNRYGRRGFADIRYGSIARYLTDSLIRWQPALQQNGGGKITSPNHRALADFLAEYGLKGSTFDNLTDILREAKLIDSAISHPFLADKVLLSKPRNIEELYKVYLNAEQVYAKSLISTLQQGKNIKAIKFPAFIRFNSSRWQTDAKTAANRYLHIPPTPFDKNPQKSNAPIMLPDGLFYTYIMELLRKMLKDVDEGKTEDTRIDDLKYLRDVLNDNKTFGTAYIIRYWFDNVENDDTQEFYGIYNQNDSYDRYGRFYPAISKLAPHRQNKQLIPDYFTEKQINTKLKITRQKNHGKLSKTVKELYSLSTNKQVEEKCESVLAALSKVSDNERTIRRYRIQDITLFLTLRRMLTSMLSQSNEGKSDKAMNKNTAERIKNMYLSDFGFDYDFDLLGGADNESAYTYTDPKSGIKITMPSLSLRNYGSIFRIISDSRFESLMKGLASIGVKTVDFTDLISELALHDRERSRFLQLAQQIEQEAYDANLSVLSDYRMPGFYRRNIERKDSNHPDKITNPSTDAKRNHFGDLVTMLEKYADTIGIVIETNKKTGETSEIELKLYDLLVELRNAAAHNRYPDKDFFLERLKEHIGKQEFFNKKMKVGAPNYVRIILDFIESIILTKTGNQ